MTSNASQDNSPSSSQHLSTHSIGPQASALRGAALAYNPTSIAPKPLAKTYSGANGALAAASAAGVGRRKHEDSSAAGVSSNRQQDPLKISPLSKVANVRNDTRHASQSMEHSPSYTAALLATSRSATPISSPTLGPTPPSRPNHRRPSPLQSLESVPKALTSSPAVDSTPSQPTNSLVHLFESKEDSSLAKPVTKSVRYVNKTAPPIASPTPVRPLNKFNSSAALPSKPPPVESTANGITRGRSVLERSYRHAATTEAENSADQEMLRMRGHDSSNVVSGVPKPPPPQRNTRPLVDGSEDGFGVMDDGIRSHRAPQSPPQPASRPRPKRAKTSGGKLHPSNHPRVFSSVALHTTTSDATEKLLNDAAAHLRSTSPPRSHPHPPSKPRPDIILAPTRQPSNPPSRPAMQAARSFESNRSPGVDSSRSSRAPTGSLESYSPQLSINSLANAMVASSLASSRAPSPTKPHLPPLPPPPRRHGFSLFHHHNHPSSQEALSRTPSPAKGMRHTMREPVKSEDEEEGKHRRRGGGGLVRKHKHHEGDRKRYRNQVTERERKRYEGLWAANKALFLDLDFRDDVVNIIVRDIWRRSRLPDDVLGEVWDLVDTQGMGRLAREEFVVGMFLIDSRLKGNKLPYKVSDSLWYSVRRLEGIKVPKNWR